VLRCSLGSEATAFDEGYKLGMSLDIRGIGFEGILLFNDLVAMGFQKALIEKGFAIPDDIAVVGFDNIDRCSEARVPLTTISVPRREIGQAALAKLVDIIRNKIQIQPERILLEPELIVRSSA
jgi:DNA-binding LacI/PurR family transcriptional regulator